MEDMVFLILLTIRSIDNNFDNCNDIKLYHFPHSAEDLAAIDDHISESFSAADEFADDHAYQTETDVDLHRAYDRRDTAWNHYFCQCVEAVAPEGVDQGDFLRVYGGEAGVQVQNAAEDGNRHSGYNDSGFICAEPYNKEWGKRRFRQAVQYHEVGVQYLGEPLREPQENSHQNTEYNDQNKTDQCFV